MVDHLLDRLADPGVELPVDPEGPGPRGGADTVHVHAEVLRQGFSMVGNIPKIPIEPVIVSGLAQISSEEVAIEYPPDAATLPIETTTGFFASWASCSSRRITSEAKALPPPLSTRRTIALTFSSCGLSG